MVKEPLRFFSYFFFLPLSCLSLRPAPSLCLDPRTKPSVGKLCWNAFFLSFFLVLSTKKVAWVIFDRPLLPASFFLRLDVTRSFTFWPGTTHEVGPNS